MAAYEQLDSSLFDENVKLPAGVASDFMQALDVRTDCALSYRAGS